MERTIRLFLIQEKQNILGFFWVLAVPVSWQNITSHPPAYIISPNIHKCKQRSFTIYCITNNAVIFSATICETEKHKEIFQGRNKEARKLRTQPDSIVFLKGFTNWEPFWLNTGSWSLGVGCKSIFSYYLISTLRNRILCYFQINRTTSKISDYHHSFSSKGNNKVLSIP